MLMGPQQLYDHWRKEEARVQHLDWTLEKVRQVLKAVIREVTKVHVCKKSYNYSVN